MFLSSTEIDKQRSLLLMEGSKEPREETVSEKFNLLVKHKRRDGFQKQNGCGYGDRVSSHVFNIDHEIFTTNLITDTRMTSNILPLIILYR